MQSRKLASQRYAALSGIAFVVLFIGGSSIWGLNQPVPGASVDTIVDFYRDTSGRIIAGASLSIIAFAFFTVFASGLRTVLIEAEGDELLGTIAFAGAILSIATGLGAETINMAGALRAHDGLLTDELALAVFDISYVLGSTASGAGLCIFILATAAVALRTGIILPRWLAIVTILLGIVWLTPLSRYFFVPLMLSLVIAVIIAVQLLRMPVGGGQGPQSSTSASK